MSNFPDLLWPSCLCWQGCSGQRFGRRTDTPLQPDSNRKRMWIHLPSSIGKILTSNICKNWIQSFEGIQVWGNGGSIWETYNLGLQGTQNHTASLHEILIYSKKISLKQSILENLFCEFNLLCTKPYVWNKSLKLS